MPAASDIFFISGNPLGQICMIQAIDVGAGSESGLPEGAKVVPFDAKVPPMTARWSVASSTCAD